MNNRYDVIVVGGGPGGSWTAKHAAEGGASVLLLEKDRDIGLPVRCAEGVTQKAIRNVIELEDKWIAQTVTGAHLVSPNGTVVESYPGEVGYVLQRKIFDYDLAVMAVQEGVEIVTRAYVNALLMENSSVTGVQIVHLGKKYRISSSIVVGADGFESRIGYWGGLQTRTLPSDMVSCVQMTLAGININPNIAKIYFGRHIAPGGYLWIFPKGNRTANVGLGISGIYSSKKKPLIYLQEFVKREFPKASILTLTAGSVPLVPTLKNIINNGLMLVGDAAHQADPVSGGGIVNAMIAGRIAGKVAAEAVYKGDVSVKQLSAYPKEWHKVEGKNHEKSYKLKKALDRLSDEDLDRAAKVLLDVPPKDRTAFRIFKEVLFKHPKLILEAAKIFL